MELDPKDIMEMFKAVPAMQAEVAGLKNTLAGFDREIDSISKTVMSLEKSVGHLDSSMEDISAMKRSLAAMQETVNIVADKLKDLSEKYRDVLDAIKNHDRNTETTTYQMMRTIYGIENTAKEALNRHDSETSSLQTITKSLDSITQNERAIVKNATNGSDQGLSLLGRLLSQAPSIIAVLSFFAYIIYNLIEHKLMGKM